MGEAEIIQLHGDRLARRKAEESGHPSAEPAAPSADPTDASAPEVAAAPIDSEPPTSAPADVAGATEASLPTTTASAPAPSSAPVPGDAGGAPYAAPARRAERVPSEWERKAADGLAFLRRRITGDYDVDEFGFDPDLTEAAVLPVFRQLYHRWFRTEVEGISNIPIEGNALIVGNHAGALWALDGAMTATAVHEETPNKRFLRMLGADLLFTTPALGPLARKTGSTLACNPDAERLLNNGELVGVWPEGFKGIGKPYSERYKLQRFGRGGFVSAALRTGAPIIPTSIVGSEEIHPMLGNAKTIARVLGLPYFPLTPTFPWLGPLGAIPLPSKWYIEFGDPIETAGYGPEAAEDAMLVFELTDRVRETIQSTLYRILMQRKSIWR